MGPRRVAVPGLSRLALPLVERSMKAGSVKPIRAKGLAGARVWRWELYLDPSS
jgi:hypothetical protein